MSVPSAPGIPTSTLHLLSGGGEMAQLINAFDWQQTPLGASERWPLVLQLSVGTMLRSPFPMLLYWGEQLTILYNDAFRNTLGSQGKHPYLLGKPAKEGWAEIWNDIGAAIEGVLENGEAFIFFDRLVPILRNGHQEDVYWTFSHSPVPDEQGNTCGVLTVCTETTKRVNKLHNIVNLTTAPIMIFKGPDLIVEEANQATLDLWQAGPEVIGKPFLQVKPEFKHQPFIGWIRQVYETGQPYRGYEYPAHFHRADGSIDTYYFNFEYNPYREANGDIAGVMILATDVTSQVLHKKELAVAEDEMRVAIGAAHLGYFNYNPVTGLLNCNERIQELFGLPIHTKPALESLLQTIPEQELDAVRKAAETALDAKGTGRFETNFRVVLPGANAPSRHLRAIGQAYFDANGLPYRLSGTVQDITSNMDYETSLRRSEEKYRGLFENMDQGFCIIEVLFDKLGQGYDFRFLEYNQKLTEHSGLQNAVGKTMRELVPGIEDLWARIYGDVVLTGQPARFVQKSGAMDRWFEVSAYRLDDGSRRQVAILFSDITQRKQNEEALRQSEERSRLALESGGMAAWVLDLQTNHCTVDEFTYRMFQVDPATYNGGLKVLLDRVIAADQPSVGKALQEAALFGTPYKAEFRVQLPDGTQKWLFGFGTVEKDPSGRPVIIRGLHQDITERKKVEIALLEQQQFVESLVAASPSLTYIYDLEQDGNTYASPQVASILGYSKEEVQAMGGNFLPHVMHPDDKEAAFHHLQQMIGSGNDKVYDLEYRMLHKDGHYVWLFDRSRVFRRSSEGKAIQVLGVATDITQRKELEQNLAKQFEELENIYRTAPIGLGLLDRELRFIRINEKLAQINGLPAAEHVGKTIYEVVPGIAAQAEGPLRQVFDSGTPLLQVELTGETNANPGVVRTWMESWFPIKNSQGETEAISMVVEEITERRKTETILKESEDLFRSFSNNIQNLAWIADGEGWIHWYNQRWYDYTGICLEDMQGWGWEQVHHPAHLKRVVTYVSAAWQKGEPWELTFPLRRHDGAYRWFLTRAEPIRDEQGRVVRWIGTNTDIQDQVVAQGALQQSEEQLRQLADFMPQIVWAAKPDGYHDFYNRRWYEFTGLNTASTNDAAWKEVMHPEDYEANWQLWQQSLRDGTMYETEYRMRRHDGKYRWLLARAMPIRNDANNIVRWLGTCTDIHDQKNMARQLEETVQVRTQELQRSNADLQQFAHVASHDLKEPVRKIRTFISFINQQFGATMPSKASLYLEKVDKAANRMMAMIEGVLLYSSLDALEQRVEQVDLNIIIQEIMDDLEVVVQDKKGTITHGHLVPVSGSPILIYQLLYNLIRNSLKFSRTETPPQITITTQKVYGKEQEASGPSGQKNWVQITLQDNGIGFREEEADIIFGTFTRLHSKDMYEGTGLGLSLCRKIAERHGGSIHAKGIEGIGATFEVLLPGV